MKPRFKVSSVTGYEIRENQTGSPRSKTVPRTSYAVLDSAYCYRIVREFRAARGRHLKADGELKRAAHALARKLNAEDRRG